MTRLASAFRDLRSIVVSVVVILSAIASLSWTAVGVAMLLVWLL